MGSMLYLNNTNQERIGCQRGGPEDLVMDRSKGLLFVSSSDRWHPDSAEQSGVGVYLLDLNDDSGNRPDPVKLATT